MKPAALPLPVVENCSGRTSFFSFYGDWLRGYRTGVAAETPRETTQSPRLVTPVTDAAAEASASVEGNSQQKKGQQKVHEQRWAKASEAAKVQVAKSTLRELTLEAPVRYASGDAVEAWLHRALCLDSPTKSVYALKKGLPPARALFFVRSQ